MNGGGQPKRPGRRLVVAAPSFFCWYTRLIGVLAILTWFSSGVLDWVLERDTLGLLYAVGWASSLPYGLLMLLLSVGLRRRKRSAWRILLAVLTVTLAHTVFIKVVLLPLEQVESAELGLTNAILAYAIPILVVAGQIVWLVAARREFSAVPDAQNRRLALIVFLAMLVVTGALGATVVTWNDSYDGGLLRNTAYAVLQSALGPVISGDLLGVNVPSWVDVVLGILGGGLLLVTAWALFRPARGDAHLSPEEELPARALLARYGDRDSLGYFALRSDKDIVYDPAQRAGIAYRAIGGVCLAGGDPLGDPDAWSGAIREWLAECRAHSWTPGVLGASGRGAAAYHREGLGALELGDEAILDLTAFTLNGPAMAAVRQAVRRVERAGYRVRIRRYAQIPPVEMAALLIRADDWRVGETERGFSMALGRLGDPRDGACVMVEAFDGAGALRGMLSFVPWGPSGLSLDLMRRDRDAVSGLNEFMVAKLAESAGTIGVRRISLNFAMLRSVFERGSQIGAGPVLRLTYRLLSFASRFWQLESLYLSNAKYLPTWLPRYVCFRNQRDLIAIGLASARAEGFLPSRKHGRAVPTAPEPELLDAIRQIEQEALADRVPRRTLTEQERVRHAKLDRLRAAGMEPYAPGFARTDLAADIRERFTGLPGDSRTGHKASLAGRVMLSREHGRVCFATLRDESGDIQIMLTADDSGPEALATWKSLVDLGDQVGVTGEVATSRSGELSILVTEWTMTAKSLRPLPDKRTGLTDPEARIRQRYVDLAVSDVPRRLIRMRGDAVAAIRGELSARGYLEVETPMLQPVHGGAAARPFTTHINAYGMPLYLRIAPELYLKRLLVGGMGKVFELNRSFRNEGVSPKHNPEFTMLEAYEPYGDYDSIGELTRDLVVAAARAALGTTVLSHRGAEFDLAEPWRAVTVYGSVSEALGEEVTTATPTAEVRRLAADRGVAFNPDWGQGRLVQELFEALVEDTLTAPTFVRDYPAETSPLTRRHRADPLLAEKWDLIVGGLELGTGYSELIDPIDQRARLVEQSLLAAGGDPEAMELDEDFLRALEFAMPPSGGMGMGVDRLMIVLTGRSIREIIPFPLVRPN
ncbi:bifunctional lysylphosphatidylglycerol synthetase/lysine--tRNA ligase LysX [Rhizohabitans arisaemae]|uniref:bifunctional lysylphosphatidylglycerol synthetase/lysine--tRNA ligase LysX n=1 Tax=Rhizohabitans arisaemae TaxID=2720610 RepID=UPI0024B090D3|nr:bifunctional lysylphosphatidylglycerol synthetase/lysine--tRNA ligase LysX [Rhizohabitans arisaemae]